MGMYGLRIAKSSPAWHAASVCGRWFGQFRIAYLVRIPQQILTVAGAATAKRKKQKALWSELADKATRKGERPQVHKGTSLAPTPVAGVSAAPKIEGGELAMTYFVKRISRARSIFGFPNLASRRF
jgi:hypothetical protein